MASEPSTARNSTSPRTGPPPFCSPGSILSIRPQVPKPLYYVGDTEILFCSGPRTLTRVHLESRLQSHIHSSPDATCITALAVAPNSSAVAWAEYTHDGHVRVCTMDISHSHPGDQHNGRESGDPSHSHRKPKRTKKIITGFKTASHVPLTCLNFSADSKHLLIPSSPPEVTLHYIAWDSGPNGKFLASASSVTGLGGNNPHPVLQADSNPRDPTRLAVSGRGTLKQYRLAEGKKHSETLIAVNLELREHPGEFVCHAWLPDEHFVACTAGGEVFIFEGTMIRRKIPPPRDGPHPGYLPIYSMSPQGAGFVTGCNDGVIRVYDKADVPSHYFKVHGSFAVENSGSDSRVTCLNISHSGDDLGVVLGDGTVYHFPVGSWELAKKAAAAAALRQGRAAAEGGGVSHVKSSVSLFRPLLAHFPHSWSGATGGNGQSRAALTASLASGVGHGSVVLTSPLSGTHFSPLAVSPLATNTSRPPPPTGLIEVDIALRRPLAVTISADRQLRVWNLTGSALVAQQSQGSDFLSGGSATALEGDGDGSRGSDGPGRGCLHPSCTPALEFIHPLSHMPTSISLHPLGDLVLVATDSSVSLFSIRLGGVKCIREFNLRGVSCVKFNSTGGMWASSGNGGVINVYYTYGGGLVGTLRGHKDSVRTFVWGKEDRSLASVSRDGTVILWSIIIPNAVTGGCVPTNSRAAFSNSVVVSAEGLRAEGTSRTPVLQLAFKAVSVVENENFSPTAIAFGPTEGEVCVAGIIKDGSPNAGKGKGVKFNSSASQTLGGAASEFLEVTGPVLIRLLMLQLSDERNRVSGVSGGSVLLSSQSLASASSPSLGMGSSKAPQASSKGLKLPPGVASQVTSRLVLPVLGGAPIQSLALLTFELPGLAVPTSFLFAGLGHRIPDNSDFELRARLYYEHCGLTPPSGSTPAHEQSLANVHLSQAITGPDANNLPPVTKVLTVPDPVGSVRAYRFPLISPSTSGASFSLIASKPDAPWPSHPLGFLEKGGLVGHEGPCVAMAFTPGEPGHLLTAGAEGGFIQWSIDTEALGKTIESVKGSLGQAAAATAAVANTAAEGGGGASSPRNMPASLGNALGGSPLGANWLPWEETVSVGSELLAGLEVSREQLSRRHKELNASNKHAALILEKELSGLMEEVEEKYEEELVSAREATGVARETKQEVQERGVVTVAALEERHIEEVETMKSQYRVKLESEEARCLKKTLEKVAFVAEEEARLASLTESRAVVVSDLKIFQAEELEAAHEEFREIELQMEELGSEGRTKEGMLGESLDSDLESTRAKLELRVIAEAKNAAALGAENAAIKQRFGALNSLLTTARDEVGAFESVETELDGRIKGLDKDRATLSKELSERDAMLEEKDARILEAKRRAQELEKFKFVLNYKIQELKRAVMPRKRDIANLRITLNEMETELLQVHKSSSLLDIMVTELDVKKRALTRGKSLAEHDESLSMERFFNIQRDMASLRDFTREASRLYELSQACLQAQPSTGSVLPPPDKTLLMESSAKLKALRGILVSLYKKYILGETSSANSTSLAPTIDEVSGKLLFPVGAAPDEVAEEVARSRIFLEKAVAGLRVKVDKDENLSKRGAVKLMSENTALLKELNDLRRALRFSWGEYVKAGAKSKPGLEVEVMQALGNLSLGGADEDSGDSAVSLKLPPPTPIKMSSSTPTVRPTAPILSQSRRSAALLGIVGSKGAQ